MSERASTKGPWRVADHNSCVVWDSLGLLVADTGGRQSGGLDEPENNALLIAAAPDLLEALCLAHDYLAANGWEGDERMRPILSALAKAEGRTNLADATPNPLSEGRERS